MSAKDVKFGDNARSQMLDGVNTLANAVKGRPLTDFIEDLSRLQLAGVV